MRRRVAAVFVMVPQNEPNRIVGYYTLSSASVLLDDLPVSLTKKLPRYPMIPAILLGRLARDARCPGIGGRLLCDALCRAHRHARDIAAAVILVDAKNDRASEFYTRHGFVALANTARKMFLPMTVVDILVSTTSDANG